MANNKICLLCGEVFIARNFRFDELCNDCLPHKKMVARYRGTGGQGSIGPGEKRRILESKTTHWGMGRRFDAIDRQKNPAAFAGKTGQV